MVKPHHLPWMVIGLGGGLAYFLWARVVPNVIAKAKPKTSVLSTPSKPVTGIGTSNPTLRKGDTGLAVSKLQLALGEPTSGTFSDSLVFAVKEFQKTHGLTPDGVVGPATWAKLK